MTARHAENCNKSSPKTKRKSEGGLPKGVAAAAACCKLPAADEEKCAAYEMEQVQHMRNAN